MPNPTPPVDMQAAIDKGQYIRAHGNRIYLGEEKEANTSPEASGFRFVVMFAPDNSKWSGYLWREDLLKKNPTCPRCYRLVISSLMYAELLAFVTCPSV